MADDDSSPSGKTQRSNKDLLSGYTRVQKGNETLYWGANEPNGPKGFISEAEHRLRVAEAAGATEPPLPSMSDNTRKPKESGLVETAIGGTGSSREREAEKVNEAIAAVQGELEKEKGTYKRREKKGAERYKVTREQGQKRNV